MPASACAGASLGNAEASARKNAFMEIATTSTNRKYMLGGVPNLIKQR